MLLALLPFLVPQLVGAALLPRQNGTNDTSAAISAAGANSTSDGSSQIDMSSGATSAVPSASAASNAAGDSTSSDASSDISATMAASVAPAAQNTGKAAATTTYVGTGPDDLGWIQTDGLPTQTTSLLSTNPEAITPTATGPVGGMGTSPVNFNGDYSSSALEKFWDDWVRPFCIPPKADN